MIDPTHLVFVKFHSEQSPAQLRQLKKELDGLRASGGDSQGGKASSATPVIKLIKILGNVAGGGNPRRKSRVEDPREIQLAWLSEELLLHEERGGKPARPSYSDIGTIGYSDLT